MASIDRIRRLLQLIELLQSGRNYNSTQLADLCNVSRRTIFRDLRALEDSGIHVRYDEGRQGYSLPATTFLPPTDFTLEETLSLLVLCDELGNGESGIPFHRPARSAAHKLLSNLPAHLREFVGELTGSIAVRLDAHNPLNESKPHYELLTKALAHHRQVRLRYRSLTERKDISTLLSPYRMLFNRRSWYVIGRSSLHRAVRTFNVGRVLKAELLDSQYRPPPRFSLERHLSNAWNLIKERGKRYRVRIRFQPLVAHNVAEVQWHKTQQLRFRRDGTLDFRVTVGSLKEILWWVLGYGDQAEVLEPPELRRQITQKIESMRNTYRPPKRTAKHRKTSR